MSKTNSKLVVIKQQLKQLHLPEFGTKGLLIFQSGSFGLRAALFKADKNYASIVDFAQSKQVDFTRAIAEVYQQLKKQQKSVPRRCILISPSVVSANLSLPVSPIKPKLYSDMQELIRWEIDGAMNDDNKQWLIGSMLVERGYLTSGQREEIVTELELRQDQGGDAAMTRFGDLAVELEYLTDKQLQECFSLQNKLLELEQNSVFGYQAEITESPLDSQFSGLSDDALVLDNENQTEHPWLVAGLGRNIRKRWHGAFALNGLKLEAFYPDNGATFAALGLRSHEENHYLIEIHASHLVFLQGSGKNLKTIKTKARHDGDLNLDEVLSICPSDIARNTEQLYLYSLDDSLDELCFALSEHLHIEVSVLAQARPKFILPKDFNSNGLLPFIGIANHFLKFAPQGRACAIPAKDKEPPLWQKLLQPKVMIVTAAGLGLLAATGFIVWMQINLDFQTQRLVELEDKYEKENKVKQQYGKIKSDYKLLEAEINSIQEEIILNDKLYKHLNNELLPASTAVPGALLAIANAINEGVLIEQVSLKTDAIEIDGRALKTHNASLFAQKLNENLRPWRYQVGETQSTQAEEETTDGVFLDYKMHLTIGRRYFAPEPEQEQGQENSQAQLNARKDAKKGVNK
ncbi:MAG: hypothetical protein OCD00_13785 [Colwellia sp.]